MGFKSESVSMPMASAGILGTSPDMMIGGKEIEPKFLIIFTVGLVLVVKIVSLVI